MLHYVKFILFFFQQPTKFYEQLMKSAVNSLVLVSTLPYDFSVPE